MKAHTDARPLKARMADTLSYIHDVVFIFTLGLIIVKAIG